MTEENSNQTSFLFYQSYDGTQSIQVALEDETVWASQKIMAEIFDVNVKTINEHLQNIFSSNELDKEATIRNFRIVQQEGSRSVTRNIEYYNLDAIISVGYRVNSTKATLFRIWATRTLKEYLVKGFVLDDDRLKQGQTLFGKDYFEELLERIREIRASERRFYQKITDIYAQCSSDYDPTATITKTFYATVQNKLHFAIHKSTASELIKLRANATQPNMGLTTWKNQGKNGKILKTDVTIAKNYLSEDEIKELNRLVNMYLDFAELMASRNKIMTMEEWASKLDAFLQFNDYNILSNAGTVKAELAKKIAYSEYEKFRPLQDKLFKSDFDKLVEKAKKPK